LRRRFLPPATWGCETPTFAGFSSSLLIRAIGQRESVRWLLFGHHACRFVRGLELVLMVAACPRPQPTLLKIFLRFPQKSIS
jgi:hypothetical protein